MGTYRGLHQRLSKAQVALLVLMPPPGRGRRQSTEEAPLRKAAQSILTRHDVEGLLTAHLQCEVQSRSIRAGCGRPARVEEYHRYIVQVQPNSTAIGLTRLLTLACWAIQVTYMHNSR